MTSKQSVLEAYAPGRTLALRGPTRRPAYEYSTDHRGWRTCRLCRLRFIINPDDAHERFRDTGVDREWRGGVDDDGVFAQPCRRRRRRNGHLEEQRQRGAYGERERWYVGLRLDRSWSFVQQDLPDRRLVPVRVHDSPRHGRHRHRAVKNRHLKLPVPPAWPTHAIASSSACISSSLPPPKLWFFDAISYKRRVGV